MRLFTYESLVIDPSGSSTLLTNLTTPCYNGDDSLSGIMLYVTDMVNITYKLVTTDEEMRDALEVRRQVFVQEQGVSEDLEYDGQDEDALQMVVKNGGRVIGTARVRFLTNNRAKIERMAVLRLFRRRGIGSNIFSFLKRELKSRQTEQIIIHAQCAVIAFHKSCGFKEIGLPFWEAGIKHRKMQLQL